MAKDRRSFFERLTGSVSLRDEAETYPEIEREEKMDIPPEEGELSIDVYQNQNEIVIKTMVAGVRPEDLDVSISRDMVTIKGKREAPKGVASENYFYQELYWGSFSRTILLPAEIETEDVEATERRGLLTIKLPKIDKGSTQTVKIKSL